MATKLRSAIEGLKSKLEEDDGTEVNITVVVDAEAEAVEEALNQEEANEEIAEGEAMADQDEAGQDEAAELYAMADVLRQHGLTPSMQALLEASGKHALYGIVLPARESLDATGRNMSQAEALAASFEASANSFLDSTRKFFAEMWDKIKRMFIFIKTHIGALEGKVKRAHDSLSGKTLDAEKVKNADKFYDFSDPSAITAAASKLLEGLHDTATKNRKNIKLTDNELPDEADIKAATGYKYAGENKDRLEEDDKDFLKGDELVPSQALFSQYQGERFTKVMGIVALIKKSDSYVTDAESCKKLMIDMTNAASKTSESGKMDEETKTMLKKSRDITSSWLKIIGRVTKVLTRVCTMYITGCAKMRACAKV